MRDITPHGTTHYSLIPGPRFGVGSPFPLILHRFKHLLRMRLGVDLLGGKDVGDGARFVGYEGGAKGAHVLASAH